MAIATIHRQALEAMKRSNHTLVCFPEHAGGDAIGTALGLAIALEKLRPGHQVDIVSTAFNDAGHRERFTFLPTIARIQPTITQLHDLTIRVNLKNAKVRELRYDVHDDHLDIHLTPTSGELSQEHVNAAMSGHKYDLIVTVDCADLPALGALYTDHASFFQATPIVNIDHAPENERYGHINLIDLAASACGEIGATFLRDVAPEHLDADIATCFLTGIIAETQGFRRPQLSPRTLELTAALLTANARREEIVQHLFQTKTIAQLKLWGRALSRMRADAERKVVWALVAQSDFLASGTSELDLHGIVDELLANAPDAQLIIIMHEQPDRTIMVTARSPHGHCDATSVLKTIGGSGTPALARATLANHDLVTAERTIADLIRSQIPARRAAA